MAILTSSLVLKFAIENSIACGTARSPNEKDVAETRAHMKIINIYWKGVPLGHENRIVCRGFCLFRSRRHPTRASSIVVDFPAFLLRESFLKALPYLLIISIEHICLPWSLGKHSALRFIRGTVGDDDNGMSPLHSNKIRQKSWNGVRVFTYQGLPRPNKHKALKTLTWGHRYCHKRWPWTRCLRQHKKHETKFIATSTWRAFT
jgi:hypothetical protein